MMNSSPKETFRAWWTNKRQALLKIISRFGPGEKTLFYVALALFALGGTMIIGKLNDNFLVNIPERGGMFTEGVIGMPHHINPVLATTDIDKDLSSLIYAGLMRISNGNAIKDLADNYKVSEDGLEYQFTLKSDIYFHDNTPITADDFIFTIERIQDSTFKSPRRVSWADVKVEKIDNRNIKIVLKKPYGLFLENATLGILPKHIWQNINAEQFSLTKQNLEPIGSGPWYVQNITKDAKGLPISYMLKSANKWHRGRAYINNIEFRFFNNQNDILEALKNGEINSLHAVTPEIALEIKETRKDLNVEEANTPRAFAVFFNTNNSKVLSDGIVRKALEKTVDRESIVKEIFFDYAKAIDEPRFKEDSPTNIDLEENIKLASSSLEKALWFMNSDNIREKKINKDGKVEELSFVLAIPNGNEFKKVADKLEKNWAKIGAKVIVEVYELGDFYQSILRTRKYDAILFGQDSEDLYAFWHSSQKNYPGSNFSMYVNSKADEILEERRTIMNKERKEELYEEFRDILKEDVPAVFIYMPKSIYISPSWLHKKKTFYISRQSDRFDFSEDWYIKIDKVWKVFIPKSVYERTNFAF